MNQLLHTGTQLCLPLAPKKPPEPAIADAGDVVIHQRRPDSHKLPAEFTDAELLTKVFGPSTALSCEWLTTTYDDLHAIALLSHADLSQHGLTTGAIEKLGAVFEIAKRYGEREWRVGQPLRGSGDVYTHFREHLAGTPSGQPGVTHLFARYRTLRSDPRRDRSSARSAPRRGGRSHPKR